MQREIIVPQSDVYNLHIPKEYINKKIEILVLPLSGSDLIDKEITDVDLEANDVKLFSGHSVNLIEEWKGDSEDQIWI